MATDAQSRVQALLHDLVDSGMERGLQVAAYFQGNLVVDAWAGMADAASGRPVDGETLFTSFSVTKGIAATVIHRLAERGLLEYDAPIAHYWPEFGQQGKEWVTLRHALTHSAGIPQLPEGIGPEELCNWEVMCRAVADLRPLWEPGTGTGYHALTFGWIVGEVARRVTGLPFGEIVQEDICRPLEISSLYCGIPDEAEPRVATLEMATPQRIREAREKLARLVRGEYGWRTITRKAAGAVRRSPVGPSLPAGMPVQPAFALSAAVYNRPEVRRACLPASGGIMNGRAIARHYAALIGDGVDGVRLLTPERVRMATALQTAEVDLVQGWPMRKGLGYLLAEPHSPMGPVDKGFGHPGLGGVLGFADPVHGLAFGLTKNSLTQTGPGRSAADLIVRELRAALRISVE